MGLQQYSSFGDFARNIDFYPEKEPGICEEMDYMEWRRSKSRNRQGSFARSRSAGPEGPLMFNHLEEENPREWDPAKNLGATAKLELRAVVDSAKRNIKQFYDMYDKKMKSQMTHPLFRSLD